MVNDKFFGRLKADLIGARRQGEPYKEVRMSAEQAKLIEAEYAVQYVTTAMTIVSVPIVVDDAVPFGEYTLR